MVQSEIYIYCIYEHSHDHVSGAPSSPVFAVLAGGFEDES